MIYQGLEYQICFYSVHINSPTNYSDAVEEISERMDLPSEVIDVYCWLVGWLVGWMVSYN